MNCVFQIEDGNRVCKVCSRIVPGDRPGPLYAMCRHSSHHAPRDETQTTQPPPSAAGPGHALHELLTSIGFSAWQGCGCNAMVNQMNAWGVAGCQQPENRATILAKLRVAAKQAPLVQKLSAYRASRRQGLKLSIRDPAGSLLDEALRRAEQNQQ